MPDRRWIAVRCCCEPKKVLGFILLGEYEARRGRMFLYTKPKLLSTTVVDLSEVPEIVENSQRVEVRFELMRGPYWNDTEVAIYSEDRPIEFWRTVVGFVEAKDD